MGPPHAPAMESCDRRYFISSQDGRFLRACGISRDTFLYHGMAELPPSISDWLRTGNLPMQMFTLYDFARTSKRDDRLIAASQYVRMLQIISDTSGRNISDGSRRLLEEEMARATHEEGNSPLVPFTYVEELYRAFFPRHYLAMTGEKHEERDSEAIRVA